MLDSKHKKYIDDLCDILVAKFPVPQDQVDQITIALTYKFMCDMDKESVALGGKVSFFKGDWSKYSWESLFDSKTTGDERKAIYQHVVENLGLNPNLQPLFRDIFSNPPNPFNDVKKLFEFLKIIDKFSYENSETLGNSYEYLLSKTGAQGKLGQFRTPRHIIDFIVEIVNPKSNEKILDPACGTAGFLVSAFKHIRANEKNLSAEKLLKLSENLIGYDIEPKMIRISLLNLFLQGFQTPKILESDLLSDDLFWNDYFDVMLANPPFFTPKGGISAHRGFNLESKRAEVHFLDFIQSHIKPDGRAGVIVPEGVLFKDENAYKTLRKNIIQNSLIGVVSLPAGVFKPYSGVKTAILFLDKKVAKQTDSIFFGIVNNDGYALNDNRDPIDKNDLPKVRDSIIKGNVNDDFFYTSKEEVLNEKKFLLTANSYKKIKKINSEYPIVPITDVYKVVTPSAKIKKRDFLTKGKYPIIDQSQDDIAGYWDRDQDKMNFNNPVIIFGDHTRSVKYIDFEFVVGADGVKILEPKDNILPKFLFYILKTLKIRNLGYSRHYKELKDKKIPLPTLEVQQEIVDELEGYQKIIEGNKKTIEIYSQKIQNKINKIWGED
ncbi:N-6 DNA methylase [Gammaproteobacteria bacterium]|nr:N-6 DNA methylase [Gammaproteobacteria bacterium]